MIDQVNKIWFITVRITRNMLCRSSEAREEESLLELLENARFLGNCKINLGTSVRIKKKFDRILQSAPPSPQGVGGVLGPGATVQIQDIQRMLQFTI